MPDEVPYARAADQQALIDESGRIAAQYSDGEFAPFATKLGAVGVATLALCAELKEVVVDIEALASARDRSQARYRLASNQTRQVVDEADDLFVELNSAIDLAVQQDVEEARELEYVMTALGADTDGYRATRFTLQTAIDELGTYEDLTVFRLEPDFLERAKKLNEKIRDRRDSASVYEIRRQVHVYALHKRIDRAIAILTELDLGRKAAMARAEAAGEPIDIPGFDLAFLRAAAASIKAVKLDRADPEPSGAGM